MPIPPKPQLVRQREGNSDHKRGGSVGTLGVSHADALPEKPSWLSTLASEIWDDYLRYSAPGLLKLVHAMGLGQLCEDKALEIRLRKSIAACEERLMSQMVERVLETPPEPSKLGDEELIQDPSGLVGGDPLAILTQDVDRAGIFRVLNQVVLRVQRQEQQFGLTPKAAASVEITSANDPDASFEDALCG